ncbi:MAG: hypothetical protein ACFB6S_08010 [Geminicoccaceae bacterium]
MASLDAWLNLLVTDPKALPSDLAQAVSERQQVQTQAQTDMAEALFPVGTQVFSIRPSLERTKMPCRMIVSPRHKIIPAGHRQNLPAEVALHRLSDVGHMLHLDATGLTARLVRMTVKSAG